MNLNKKELRYCLTALTRLLANPYPFEGTELKDISNLSNKISDVKLPTYDKIREDNLKEVE